MSGRSIQTAFCLTMLAANLVVAAVPDPGAQAADYYFAHYDYAQAFTLWNGVFQRQPDSVAALLRLSELRLMFEGHAAVAKSMLEYLSAHQATISRENRRQVREKLSALQSVFLTDDGQALFLQGLARSHGGDCLAALPFFSQAEKVEKGNVKVLREEAACETNTGAFDRNYTSLKHAYELQPFDSDVVDALSESYLYYSENQKVLELFPAESEAPHTLRQRTAQAVALYRSGATAPALLLLESLAAEKSAVSPIVFFELGKALAEAPAVDGRRAQAIAHLKYFLSRVPDAPVVAPLVPAWDPYRLSEQAAEARTLLASLQTR